jgi:hypothetical protein
MKLYIYSFLFVLLKIFNFLRKHLNIFRNLL